MNLKDIIKRYGGNNMDILSDTMTLYVPDEEMQKLCKIIYEGTLGKHFNEEFAREQISKMYYEDNGHKHFGPFYDDVTAPYSLSKRKLIYPYNKWDFEVTLNMMKSDMINLLKEWFPEASEKELDSKIIDLAINWLNDEDYGESKIWCYFK